MDKCNCFYVPGQPCIIDMAVQTETGEWVGKWSRESFMVMRDERPELVMGDFDEWFDKHEQSLITSPREIDKAEWWEALEVLPPESWQHSGGGESFVMMEYYSGRITSIYVRLGERYFTFRDVANLPHLDRLAKARTLLG